MKSEENKKQEELNDEQLDNVAGGICDEDYAISEITKQKTLIKDLMQDCRYM